MLASVLTGFLLGVISGCTSSTENKQDVPKDTPPQKMVSPPAIPPPPKK